MFIYAFRPTAWHGLYVAKRPALQEQHHESVPACEPCVLDAGAEDGSIKVWNFRSGALLSTLSQNPDLQGPGSQWGSGSGVEVTGLTVSSSADTNGQAAPCIVATGWDRKVWSKHLCMCRWCMGWLLGRWVPPLGISCAKPHPVQSL